MTTFAAFMSGALFGCFCLIGVVAVGIGIYDYKRRQRGDIQHGREILRQSEELRDRDLRHRNADHNFRNISTDPLGKVHKDDWEAMI